MKNLIITLFAVASSLNTVSVVAQQVPKKILVEHFTNSHCSICASRNPGLYTAIAQYSEVLHIAYHLSSPYAGCLINQHNKTENDNRTNAYNIYGGTPRLVIQGNVLPANANYGNTMLYQNEQNKMSSFAVTATITKAANNTADVTIVIKKVDTSTLTSLTLYAAITEDTLFYNAPNGENKHYDVFRKSVWGDPKTITAPVNIGDSIIETQNISINQVWITNRTTVTAIIQDAGMQVVQAARSNKLDNPLSVSNAAALLPVTISPNPTTGILKIDGLQQGMADVAITTINGSIVYNNSINSNHSTINVEQFSPGIYFISVQQNGYNTHIKFIKQ